MPTNINQTRDDERQITTLRVDGEMLHDDAILLEKIVDCMREETGDTVTVDIADLDLLDSDAAPILRRMGDQQGVSLVGIEIFLQTSINNAERGDP